MPNKGQGLATSLEAEGKRIFKKLMEVEDPEVDAVLLRPGQEWSSEERVKVGGFLEKHREYFEIQARLAGLRVTGHDPGEEFGKETWEAFVGDWWQIYAVGEDDG